MSWKNPLNEQNMMAHNSSNSHNDVRYGPKSQPHNEDGENRVKSILKSRSRRDTDPTMLPDQIYNENGSSDDRKVHFTANGDDTRNNGIINNPDIERNGNIHHSVVSNFPIIMNAYNETQSSPSPDEQPIRNYSDGSNISLNIPSNSNYTNKNEPISHFNGKQLYYKHENDSHNKQLNNVYHSDSNRSTERIEKYPDPSTKKSTYAHRYDKGGSGSVVYRKSKKNQMDQPQQNPEVKPRRKQIKDERNKVTEFKTVEQFQVSHFKGREDSNDLSWDGYSTVPISSGLSYKPEIRRRMGNNLLQEFKLSEPIIGSSNFNRLQNQPTPNSVHINGKQSNKPVYIRNHHLNQQVNCSPIATRKVNRVVSNVNPRSKSHSPIPYVVPVGFLNGQQTSSLSAIPDHTAYAQNYMNRYPDYYNKFNTNFSNPSTLSNTNRVYSQTDNRAQASYDQRHSYTNSLLRERTSIGRNSSHRLSRYVN